MRRMKTDMKANNSQCWGSANYGLRFRKRSLYPCSSAQFESLAVASYSLQAVKNLVFSLRFLWLFAVLFAVSAFGQAPGKLTLKSGVVWEYLEARVEGNQVVIKLSHGTMRLPVSTVSEESLLRIGGSPALAAARATPTPAASPATVSNQPGSKETSPAGPVKEEQSMPPPVREHVPAPGARPELWKHLPRALSVRPDTTVMFKTKLIEFEVSGKLFENPKVKVQCLIPVDDGGRPLPGAADVVFCAPYVNQKDPVVADKFFRGIAETYGMTAFSMTIKTDPANFEGHEKYYPYAESGSHLMLLQAWDKVVEHLRVPRKNLLILANSAGATMAQRFAMLNANRVDAVSMIGGWRYDPMREPNAIAWCVLSTRGDIREEANVELAAQARALGVNMLHAITPINAMKKEDFSQQYTSTAFHHSGGISAYDIAQQFLVAVRDLRNADKNWRSFSRWPLRAPADIQWALDKEGEPSAPLAQDVYFPSDAFAAVWLRNENRQVAIPSADGGSRQVLIRYPQGGNPKGIIIYGGGGTEMKGRGDDMDFLGLQGFIVVGTPNESSGGLDEARTLLGWAASLEQWKSHPIFLLGFNESGRDFLALLPEADPARVKAAAAIDAPLLSATEGLAKTRQKIYVSSLDGSPGEREPFLSYLKQAGQAGANAAVIPPSTGSALLRFDLLEEIGNRFSQ